MGDKRIQDEEAIISEHATLERPPEELSDDIVRHVTGLDPEPGRERLRRDQAEIADGATLTARAPRSADIEGFIADSQPILKSRRLEA